MPHQYDCVVYSFPFELEEANDENWLTEFYLPVAEIARNVAIANSQREAAARAWARTIGQQRARKLQELDAPPAIIRMDDDRGN